MSTVKRLFFYLVYAIALGMFAAGVTMLLSLCFDLITTHAAAQIGARAFNREELSLALAMLVIGGGLWFLFWRAIQRNVSGNTVEIGSEVRKLFLNLILTVAALVALFAAADFLKWLMAGAARDVFPAGGLSRLIVTGFIWYYHWQLNEKEGQPSAEAETLRRWSVYLLSGWGLVTLAINLVGFINTLVLNLPVWGTTIVSASVWNSSLQSHLSWILLGGAFWVFHWFGMSRGDAGSTLRQVYLYLLAICGGAIAGMVGIAASLFGVFKFAFGASSTATGTYFQFLGWAVSLILVAAAIWVYHYQVAREEAVQVREQLSVRRIQYYLMSFLGLGALIAGLIILLGILLDFPIHNASQTIVVTTGWWRSQLSVSLALMIVATPIWLYYWNRVLQTVAAGGIAERGAGSRRIYLYIILGAAVVTLAADCINIIYQLLNGLLQGDFGIEVLRHSKWSLQTLVVAAPVLLYHWQILRQDQRLGAEAKAARKTVTILISDSAAALVPRFEEKLGYKVYTMRYLGETAKAISALPDKEISRLAAEIQAAPGSKVLLVASESKILVLPYQ